MRTDTERLDFIFAAMAEPDGERAERMQAAYTLELRGRAMVDAAMGAKLVEPGEPMPELTAIDLAVAEVGRIRNVKGFSEERDDGYADGELAAAAANYLLTENDRPDDERTLWPWGLGTFKPSPDDRKRELTKGIALALCELDRLIRAERREDEARAEADLETQAQVCAEMNAAACEFKVGDLVRVRSNAHDNRFGWADQMDALVGQTYPIDAVHPQTEYTPIGYLVAGWLFPAEQLEHVDG